MASELNLLFICTGNTCRSRMAEAFVEQHAHGRVVVDSAGIQSDGQNAYTIQVMAEKGIDLSARVSKNVNQVPLDAWTAIITMSERARSLCPDFPNVRIQAHWAIPDPAGASGTQDEILAIYRRTRDIIEASVVSFLKTQGVIMESITYGFKKEVDQSLEQAESRVTELLQEVGFGVLHTTDVAATLKNKIDVDIKPYKILGACNPTFANTVLGKEADIGLLLPCNVIVYRSQADKTVVAAINPMEAMKTVENPDLGGLAEEVSQRMKAVIEKL